MKDDVRKWYGHAVIEPIEPVVAGSYVTWRIIYTAGKYGIDNGGLLRAAFRFATDIGKPQTEDPSAPNYMTVSTTGDAKLTGRYIFKGHIRPWWQVIELFVRDGNIYEGDRIIITLGDTSGGSPGMTAPTTRTNECELRVFVDAIGVRIFRQLDDPTPLRILSGPPAKMVAILPSDAAVGQECRLVVKLEDAWGNVCEGVGGGVKLSAEGDVPLDGLPAAADFDPAGDSVLCLEGVRPGKAGVVRVAAVAEDGLLSAVSNPMLVSGSTPRPRRFWGDLHGQTAEGVGIGSVNDYFTFARDRAFIDFASNQANDFDVQPASWAEICEAARRFNEPGRFVSFLGYEWSGNSAGGGDHNVIFLHDDEPMRRSSHANVYDLSDLDTDCYPIDELYKAFRGRDDVLIIPHVGGRCADLRRHDADLEPLIEIYSCWGLFEWLIEEAMRRGMKVGFVANSDDHKCRPGASYPGTSIFGVYGGLTCVFAEELTREAVWKALLARRCYATSGQRIILDVEIEGHGMGEEVQLDHRPTLRCSVIGTAGIEDVEIRRGTETVYSHPAAPCAEPSNRFKIYWTGLRCRPRYFQLAWDGRLELTGARVIRAEPFAFDGPNEGITDCTDTTVAWTSQTVGDYDGVVVEVDDPEGARLDFKSEPVSFSVALRDVGLNRTEFPAREGIGAKAMIRRLPKDSPPSEVSFEWTEGEDLTGVRAYYVKVTQSDGAFAFSSPIYVTRAARQDG